jgi:glycosyltransferase involved in cell wall biosynthesis
VRRLLVDLRELEGSGIASASRGILMHVLPAIVDAGIEVAVIIKPNWEGPIDPRIRRFESTATMFSLKLHKDLAVISRKYKPDLFWSTHYPVSIFITVPMLVTVYDLYHLVETKAVSRRLYCRFMMCILRIRKARILTTSNFSAEQLRTRARIPIQRVTVLPIGIDDSWFSDDTSTPISANPYFCTVGNVSPHKNIGALLRAFALVVRHAPVRLVVIGESSALRTRDASLGPLIDELGGAVQFVGYLPLAELQSCVHGALALVTVSKYEGFGLTPIEAMAAGTSVIVSTAASLPEVCGDAAIYVDPDDIEGIADACIGVALMAPAGDVGFLALRGQAEKYSWGNVAPQLAEFVSHVLSAPTL